MLQRSTPTHVCHLLISQSLRIHTIRLAASSKCLHAYVTHVSELCHNEQQGADWE